MGSEVRGDGGVWCVTDHFLKLHKVHFQLLRTLAAKTQVHIYYILYLSIIPGLETDLHTHTSCQLATLSTTPTQSSINCAYTLENTCRYNKHTHTHRAVEVANWKTVLLFLLTFIHTHTHTHTHAHTHTHTHTRTHTHTHARTCTRVARQASSIEKEKGRKSTATKNGNMSPTKSPSYKTQCHSCPETVRVYSHGTNVGS